MQFRALNENQLILANEGKRDKAYLCPECLSALKLKKKKKGFAYFSHTQRSSLCSRTRKNLNDLEILQILISSLPKEEIVIEKLFCQNGKVADLVWESKKIVFQVVATAIEEERIEEMENLFSCLGYKAVWILDDRYFNQKYAYPEEIMLRSKSCYYAKRDSEGGYVYDQWEEIEGKTRVIWGPPLRVRLNKPYFETPNSLQFEGDLISRLQGKPLQINEISSKKRQNTKNYLESMLRALLLKSAL